MVRGVVDMVKFFWCAYLVLVCFLWCLPARAGALVDRIATFPQWQEKPPVQPAEGDLLYPDWFKGTWEVTSTLTDLVAPLAPEIVSPGFEANRQFLNQPITFQVQFKEAAISPPASALKSFGNLPRTRQAGIISDRAFNGLNLARAYLGSGENSPVLDVKVNPLTPNRQVTSLRGDRQLISLVTGRAIETPAPDQFVTTELFQQIFRGGSQPYLNQVETTTDYYYESGTSPGIHADQITAVYLSPQDPQYFKAGQIPPGVVGNQPLEALKERPVALYRYSLEFSPQPCREQTPGKLHSCNSADP